MSAECNEQMRDFVIELGFVQRLVSFVSAAAAVCVTFATPECRTSDLDTVSLECRVRAEQQIYCPTNFYYTVDRVILHFIS